MPKLTMMVGLPRSGKTTLSKEEYPGAVRVSADEIRLQMHGTLFYSPLEPLVWWVRGILLHLLLSQGLDIVVDETHTTQERRAATAGIADKYGYEIHAHWVKTSASLCKHRAFATGQGELIPVIERMAETFEPPSLHLETYLEYIHLDKEPTEE